MHYEPAATIIRKLGGLTAVSEIAGVSPTSVQRWRTSKEKGGTGGPIPHWHVPKLMKAAGEKDILLTADDFIPEPTQ